MIECLIICVLFLIVITYKVHIPTIILKTYFSYYDDEYKIIKHRVDLITRVILVFQFGNVQLKNLPFYLVA